MSDFGDGAAAASAIAAALGLFFVGAQTREAARGTSVTITQSFVARSGELLEKLKSVIDKDPIDDLSVTLCLHQIFSHFEMFVIFLHEAPLGSKMRKMIDETIVNFIRDFASGDYAEIISSFIEKPDDYCELRDYCKQREDNFRDFNSVKKMMKI